MNSSGRFMNKERGLPSSQLAVFSFQNLLVASLEAADP